MYSRQLHSVLQQFCASWKHTFTYRRPQQLCDIGGSAISRSASQNNIQSANSFDNCSFYVALIMPPKGEKIRFESQTPEFTLMVCWHLSFICYCFCYCFWFIQENSIWLRMRPLVVNKISIESRTVTFYCRWVDTLSPLRTISQLFAIFNPLSTRDLRRQLASQIVFRQWLCTDIYYVLRGYSFCQLITWVFQRSLIANYRFRPRAYQTENDVTIW